MGNIYKLTEMPSNLIISGIYKITFPNKKIYIGLSNNIRKRMLAHNEKDYKLGRLLGYAINKYGKIDEFEVLEIIPIENRKLMNEREKYWIAFYNSQNREIGYNLTSGGDGGEMGSGTNNPNASLTEEELYQILIELQYNREKSIKQIAFEFGVHKDTISAINNGRTYIQANINYPIRTKEESNKNLLTGTKSISAKLNDVQIEEVYNLLKNTKDSLVSIAAKYNVSVDTIRLINQGKRYFNNNLKYPLRITKNMKLL